MRHTTACLVMVRLPRVCERCWRVEQAASQRAGDLDDVCAVESRKPRRGGPDLTEPILQVRFSPEHSRMRRNTAKVATILLLIGSWLAWEQPVSAYLDPGSGSMLLQLLLGGVAALAVIVKLYWNRFVSLFRDRGPKQQL